MQQGKLFVISGPSGAGKSRICQALTEEGDFELSVSMTTRKPREGETDGVSYYFADRKTYDKTVEENGFLEHAEIYGNCYGTPKKPVLEKLAAGKDVILEIEMQGAMQTKAAYPDAVLIFVLPPSLKVLKERLKGRGTETESQFSARIAKAVSEIRLLENYDYAVVNDRLDEAVETIKSIAKSEHCRITDPGSIIKRYEEE